MNDKIIVAIPMAGESKRFKENGYETNLRDWFKLIYEVVFGDENGPRMGFFISFFGVNETKKLIKDKIK